MTFGVRWLLRRMDICPNAYYNYRKDRKAGYRERKEQLKDKILKIFHEYSGNPGYRMMRVYLLRAKISLSHATILKYMQELGIQSTVKPKKPAYKKGDCYKKFVNHLNREFHAEKPNEKWCTDFNLYFDGRRKKALFSQALSFCQQDQDTESLFILYILLRSLLHFLIVKLILYLNYPIF